ncbi:MAG: SMC-Scp complex subunit ScpB [Candidatus Margulisiibacteriota bacterium]|nr:SMC-Scp complex subunit ScpB [Candidatus Margulisiibacteriota bacterium]
MDKLKSVIESLLFVARKPLGPEEVIKVVNEVGSEHSHPVTKENVTACLEELLLVYQGRGINIVKVAGGYLMGTNAANADYVNNLLHQKVSITLSPQSLVTLAIIAYKQPATRAEIERIRGVNSDGPIDTLLAKGLIKEVGRSDAVGCPYLYGTTEHFMRQFGIHSLDELVHEPEPSTDM